VIRLLAAAIVLALAALPAAGQIAVPELTAEQQRTADEAMARLRSPVTPFHTVDMCPSVPALRDSIRVAAAEGMSRDQIVEDVIARYGEEIRLLPKRTGPGLLAWIATPLLLLLGAGLIAARLRRGQATADANDAAPAEDLSPEERDRLAAAMSDWEETGEVEP
jgi:cytochrome c-type biogenesis protein CcmH/NrfF